MAEDKKISGLDQNPSLDGTEEKPVEKAGANYKQTLSDEKTFILDGLSTSQVTESIDKNYVTDSEKTVIGNTSNTNTGDETDASIKTKYEANADTNAFTDAEKTVVGNTSGTNTGDETTGTIQVKRPVKTINGDSLEGVGNIITTDESIVIEGTIEDTNTTNAVSGNAVFEVTNIKADLARGSQLFDNSTVTPNTFMTSGGGLNSNPSYVLSEYIKVEPLTDYTSNKSFRYLTFFNVGKQVVSGGWNDAASQFTTTSETAYIRMSPFASSYSDLMLVVGLVSMVYEPYEVKVPINQVKVTNIVEETNEDTPITGKAVVDYAPTIIEDAKQEILQAIAPRLILQDTIQATVGVTKQIFYRGVIESLDPYNYYTKVTGDVGGKQYPRYYEFTPTTAGTYTFTISVFDLENNELSTNSCSVVVKDLITSIPSTINILPVGDSLTEDLTYLTELQRMIAGTGGTPAGLGLTNFKFIGAKGTPPINHEGTGGKSWLTMTDSSSPFWNSANGRLDFANYISVNGLPDPDYVQLLMTWNRIEPNKPNASDWVADVGYIKSFIDQLNLDFPSCKVVLGSVPFPSINGGLGFSYGDANSNYVPYEGLIRSQNGLFLAYQDIANDPIYYSYVQVLQNSILMDNENNMPESLTPVNLRSTKTEFRGTNGVHPATDGYLQIADAYFDVWNNELQ